MLSKSAEKLLRKLRTRKYRWEYKMFVAEGLKVVPDILAAGLKPEYLFSSDAQLALAGEYQPQLITEKELQSMSQLETAHKLLAVFPFPEWPPQQSRGVVIADQINDPGNLGTIIRSCDWFGISHLYLTKGSADAFNAKCVQSTMGSIARVRLVYGTEKEIEQEIQDRQLWVADMEGEKINGGGNFTEPWALVLGSESHGPSSFWKEKGRALTIAKTGNSSVESLNVAQAASIILYEMSRT